MSQVIENNNKELQNENSSEMTRDAATFVPQVDIWENDDEIVLYAEMPGVSTENLDIQFEDRQLTIHGKVEPRNSDLTYVGGEYGIGDFFRKFTIGDAVDSEQISAELKHGLLTLHLPKSEAVKPRKISVKAG